MGMSVVCCQSQTDIAQRTVFDVKSLMVIYSTDKKTTEMCQIIHLFSEATVEYSWGGAMRAMATFSEGKTFGKGRNIF